MYIKRNIEFKLLFAGSWKFGLGASLWAAIVVYLHDFVGLGLISVPIQPISTIGIAVSIYLGFKGKETYDRWWEARKIWGEIIGASRSFAAQVHALLYKEGEEPIQEIRQRLIHNHLAWVLALKYQLRLTSRLTDKKFGMFNKKVIPQESKDSFLKYLKDEQREQIGKNANPAVQILINQSRYLKELAKQGLLDSTRQFSIQQTINECIKLQGKCERIKRTPFPRSFAYLGEIFTWIFILMLPLGFIDIFENHGIAYTYYETPQRVFMFAMIPFTVLISWVFYMMEKIADGMEDPFESGVNDTPLNALARGIEIDLLESLGIEAIPPAIQAEKNVLY